MDPLSAAPAVAEVLARASSQDTSLLKPAEEQLKQWEIQPGFYSTLMVNAAYFLWCVPIELLW